MSPIGDYRSQCQNGCRYRASVSSPHICRSEQVERIVFMCGDCFATRIDSSPLSKSQIDAIRRHEREDQAEELTATPEVRNVTGPVRQSARVSAVAADTTHSNDRCVPHWLAEQHHKDSLEPVGLVSPAGSRSMTLRHQSKGSIQCS